MIMSRLFCRIPAVSCIFRRFFLLYTLILIYSQELEITSSTDPNNDINIPTDSSSINRNNLHSRKIFRKSTLPDIITDANLEIFHLRSFPQFLIDTEAGKFSMQTSALAFRNVDTQKVLVFEYTPYNYSACYLPLLQAVDNNQISLVWDKRAIVTYREELDINFWQTSTFLAMINNVVYENYIGWIGKYMIANRIFIPQAICSTADESSCFTSSQTWDTFLSDSFDVMSQLAVQMRAIIPPRGSDMQLISHIEPEAFSESSLASYSSHTKHHHRHPKRKPAPPSSSSSSYSRQLSSPSSSSSSASYRRQLSSYNLRTSSSYHHHIRRKALYEDTDDHHDDDDAYDPSSSSPSSSNITTIWTTGNTSYINGSFQSINNDTDDNFLDIANGLLYDNNTYSDHHIANISSITTLDIIDYYINMINCMQEYQLEDFTSAYKSCLHEETSFIHVHDDIYYHIMPRYPYLHVNDYLHHIPTARLVERSSSDMMDYIICIIIIIFACVGMIIAFYRLDMAIWCYYKTASMRRRRVSQPPPVEGGYSSSSSELPIYKTWLSSSSSSSDMISSNDIISSNDTTTSSSYDTSSSNDVSLNRAAATIAMNQLENNITGKPLTHYPSSSSSPSSSLPSSSSPTPKRDRRLFHPKEGIHVPRIFGGFGGSGGGDDHHCIIRHHKHDDKHDINDHHNSIHHRHPHHHDDGIMHDHHISSGIARRKRSISSDDGINHHTSYKSYNDRSYHNGHVINKHDHMDDYVSIFNYKDHDDVSDGSSIANDEDMDGISSPIHDHNAVVRDDKE